MTPCTICAREMCDHTPRQRGQTVREMCSNQPRKVVVVAVVDINDKGQLETLQWHLPLASYEKLLEAMKDTGPHSYRGQLMMVRAAEHFEKQKKEMPDD